MFLIAGPCVIESEGLLFDIAETMKAMCKELRIDYVFKASFDKANRSASFRGLGLEKGLEILAKVKRELMLPVTCQVKIGPAES